MKIISEKTGKTYETVDECLADEKKFDEATALEKKKKDELAANRKARATEVEEAYKKISEARKEYYKVLQAFIKDYGSFHMTLNTGADNPFDDFDRLFDFWF